MKYCEYCGKEINDNANFCPTCGKEVTEKETVIKEEIKKAEISPEEVITNREIKEEISIWVIILSAIVPIFGLIYYFTYKALKPKTSFICLLTSIGVSAILFFTNLYTIKL